MNMLEWESAEKVESFNRQGSARGLLPSFGGSASRGSLRKTPTPPPGDGKTMNRSTSTSTIAPAKPKYHRSPADKVIDRLVSRESTEAISFKIGSAHFLPRSVSHRQTNHIDNSSSSGSTT